MTTTGWAPRHGAPKSDGTQPHRSSSRSGGPTMKDLRDKQVRTVQVKKEENEQAKAKRENGACTREAGQANDPTDSSQDIFLTDSAAEDIFGPGGMRYGREEIDEAAVRADSERAEQQHIRNTCGMAKVPKHEQINRLSQKLKPFRRKVLDVGDAADCMFEAARDQYNQLPDQPRLDFMYSVQALREMIAYGTGPIERRWPSHQSWFLLLLTLRIRPNGTLTAKRSPSLANGAINLKSSPSRPSPTAR